MEYDKTNMTNIIFDNVNNNHTTNAINIEKLALRKKKPHPNTFFSRDVYSIDCEKRKVCCHTRNPSLECYTCYIRNEEPLQFKNCPCDAYDEHTSDCWVFKIAFKAYLYFNSNTELIRNDKTLSKIFNGVTRLNPETFSDFVYRISYYERFDQLSSDDISYIIHGSYDKYYSGPHYCMIEF